MTAGETFSTYSKRRERTCRLLRAAGGRGGRSSRDLCSTAGGTREQRGDKRSSNYSKPQRIWSLHTLQVPFPAMSARKEGSQLRPPARAPKPGQCELRNQASLEGVAKGDFNKKIGFWLSAELCPAPVGCCHCLPLGCPLLLLSPTSGSAGAPLVSRYSTAALLGCKGCLPHLKETQTHLVPILWSLALI